MNPSRLLAKAPQFYDDKLAILTYTPQKKQDIYGYQYLIKGDPTQIQGSIHKESYLEENAFGLANGDKTTLSTESTLNLGDLVSHNGTLYAVQDQTSLNKVMDLNHYILYSVFAYYNDFIIDTEEQANRILGANSARYILSMDFGIPIFPSMFKPTLNKYLVLSITNTQTRSAPYKNNDLLIEQVKQDYAELIAVGLDTNELQQVAYNIFYKPQGFALGNYPQWEGFERYTKAFDLKANIQKCDIIINYKLITTVPQDADQIIKKVVWDFNFI